MTNEEMKDQLLVAQDMIETLAQQRDAATNQVVQLMAQIKVLERKAAAVAAETKAPPITIPSQNGHDAEAVAH